MTDSNCSLDGCDRPAAKRGWCNAHYLRWRRHGDPLAGRAFDGVVGRFLRDVVLDHKGDACLFWPYARSGYGYGQIYHLGRTQYVHRIVC